MLNKESDHSPERQLIYRLLKDKKMEPLKAMVEEGSHLAEFIRIFTLLEDRSLEDLLEAGPDIPAAAAPHPELKPSDIIYRIRKSIQEPKRIFEAYQPYKRPAKGKGR